MSGDAIWDVWLLGFEPGVDPIGGLVGLFGMTEAAAQHIEMTVPRAMKRKLTRPEAEEVLRSLLTIGAKGEIREHRIESARRSLSQPQMESVRGTAPPVVVSSAPPQSGPLSGPATAQAPAVVISGAPQISDAPSSTASGAPLGTPVAGELSKTPRNVMMAIAGILFVLVLGLVVSSFLGGDDGIAAPDPGSPDAEAAALMEDRVLDARAYMNNPRASFPEADPTTVASFINACYASGASRVLVADINNVGGSDFARALLVELPEGTDGRSGIADAYAQGFLDQAGWSGESEPEGFGRRWLIVRLD